MRADVTRRTGLPPARGAVATDALSRSPLLASVAPGDLRALVRKAKTRPFRARQVLFRRGDEADGLYILVAGQVRVTIQEANGADLTLATFGVGEMLGELSALDGSRRSATAEATTAVDALYLSVDDFRRWLTTHPDAAWHLLTGLARRMRATDEQIAEIALLDVETRIARRLWQQFTEVAGGQPRPGLRLRLNQVAWASTLGATRESINKQLARLRTAGVIRREGLTWCSCNRMPCDSLPTRCEREAGRWPPSPPDSPHNRRGLVIDHARLAGQTRRNLGTRTVPKGALVRVEVRGRSSCAIRSAAQARKTNWISRSRSLHTARTYSGVELNIARPPRPEFPD